jgi:hypothetical protein
MAAAVRVLAHGEAVRWLVGVSFGAFEDGGRLVQGGVLAMAGRLGSKFAGSGLTGVALRIGVSWERSAAVKVMRRLLPGIAVGIFLSWGWAYRAERAAAQAPSSSARSSAGAAGQPRSGEPARATTAKAAVAGESGGILALIANPTMGNPIQWLYLIDTKKRAFAIYRVDPNNAKGSVKLEASRQFRWDLDLDQYNNQGLEPADVKARVDALTHSNP